jgi:uncharacterized membrane protein
MRWIVAFVVFVLALMAGAPFFGALVLGAAAWGLVRLFTPQAPEAQSSPGALPLHTKPEPAADFDDSARVRQQLRELAERVSRLEAEIAAFRLSERPQIVPARVKPAPPRIESTAPPKPQPAPAAAAAPPPKPVALPPAPPPPPPPPKRPATPAAPREPTFIYRLVTENIVAKVGAIVLFFGVGFLLKYAYDRGMMPPQLRLLGVALAAAGVFVAGWKLRLGQRRLYGLILQGVASGLAYLDVFFALKTYQFIGVPLGFSLFALLGLATTLLAVRQDAKPLAVIGLTGAFMAPLLASSGGGNVVFLFSYYLLLNLFVLAVSWFKAWRVLNLAGWFFSLAVGAVWGARSYSPALFASVEPFLLAFFAIYLIIPILFATRQPPELKGLVDGTLVFGTPAAVAVMQARLVSDMPHGLAWSSAIGAALYGVLSVMAFRHRNMRLLRQTYVALAVGLGTLAIFFAFGAYTTFALWSIEGAAILWVCLRQRELAGRLFAIAVQLGGALYFALDYREYLRFNPWFNDAVLGCVIISVASLVSAAMLRRYRDALHPLEGHFGPLLLVWGGLWWSLGGVDALTHGISEPRYWASAIGLYFTATFVTCEVVGARLPWAALRALTVPQPLVLFLCAGLQFDRQSRPLEDLGWLAWPISFAAAFWILHRQGRDALRDDVRLRYGVTWIAFGLVASWQEIEYLRQHEWLPALALALVGYLAAGIRHHLRERGRTGVQMSAIPLGWALIFWHAAGLGWIDKAIAYEHQPAAMIGFLATSALVAELLGRPLTWPGLRLTSALLPLLLAGIALLQLSRATHPLAGYASVAWLGALGAQLYILHRQRIDGLTPSIGLRYAAAWVLLAGLATWEALWWVSREEYLYTMGIALAGYLVAGLRFRASELGSERVRISTAALLWSMFFWFAGGWLWLGQQLPLDERFRAMLLVVTLTALAYEIGYRRLEWPALRIAALLPWLALPLTLVADLVLERRAGPLSDAWGLAWVFALVAAAACLRREEKENRFVVTDVRHAILLYVPIVLLTWQLHSMLRERAFGGAWLMAALAVPAALALVLLTTARDSGVWPLKEQWPIYRDRLAIPLVACLALWALVANVSEPGGLRPLTAYLPLFNPLDATTALVALAIIAWMRALDGERHPQHLWQAVGIVGFLYANAIAMRIVHYWYGVPYRFADLAHSVLLQTMLSILWTAAALTLMLLSQRYLQRKLWIAGAGLLAVVVGKLFIVDLANTGTLERIVSFLGVGVILLVIGYVAPVPPGSKEAGAGEADTVAR